MAKYIDAEAVKRAVVEALVSDQPIIAEQLAKIIDDLPDADVEPVRHGHWKPKAVMVRCLNARNYICSCCGHEPLEVTARCHNCGAKMDGGGVHG